jgi:EAL domain-containing protein (putative c-di-GMP-specific phosphodiesterase class I)/GGDEF domain-containing protein
VSGTRQDEYHRLKSAYLRLRAALRDPVTGLYSFTVQFDELRALLRDRANLGVLWVSLGDRHMIETVYGWEAYDQLLARAAELLEQIRTSMLGDDAVLSIVDVHADAFLLFVPAREDRPDLDATQLAALRHDIETELDLRLRQQSLPPDLFPGGIRVGGALLTEHPFCRFERRVYRAILEARTLAERPAESDRLGWMVELQRLLREQNVTTVFQPLVDLSTGRTIGVEAFSRGPSGSPLMMPRVMFSLGRETGLLGELDRLCRRRALSSLEDGGRRGLIFINTSLEGLMDPEWSGGDTLEQLRELGLRPSQVVLDLSEDELGAELEPVAEVIDSLRALGYRISIDNAGSSPRTVAMVERLRPDFVKFDITLVRGVADNQLGRELVRSLASLARRAGAKLVAERVETAEERDVLTACGAQLAQGHFFDGLAGSARAGGGRVGEGGP